MANILDLLGAGANKAEQGSELKSGVAIVRERTIELGSRVLWLGNIGTIRIIEGSRSYLFLIIGGLLVLAGLFTLSSDGVMGFVMFLAGAGLIYLNLNQKITGGLSIGTCDGRSTLIVSTDKEFLSNMLEFLRRKIDSENPTLQGEFNITNRHVDSEGGGIAIGVAGIAAGIAGRVETAVRSVAAAVEEAQTSAVTQPPPAPPPPARTHPAEAEYRPAPRPVVAPPPPPQAPPQPVYRRQEYEPAYDSPPTERRSGGAGGWIAAIIALIVVLGGGAGFYYYWTQVRVAPALVEDVAPPAPEEPIFTVEEFVTAVPLTAQTEGAPVRTAPSADKPPFTTLLPGEPFTINGRVVGDFPGAWLAITLPNGSTGYVNQGDLTEAIVVDEALPELPEVPAIEGQIPVESVVTGVKPEPFDITNPVWVARPDAAAFASAYPRRALEAGREGRVVLECYANVDGSLACAVAEETPRGFGFGNAALRVAHDFRLAPTLPDGRPVTGGRVRVPIVFRVG